MEFSKILEKLFNKENLSFTESRDLFSSIMSGELDEAKISAVLTALRMKGESPDEIAGAAMAMRNAALKVDTGEFTVCDTCGTGGDGTGTFNVSTAVSIALAAAGAKVAKHGNRSVSSRTGSADVLEALGVPIENPPEEAARQLNEYRYTFLFAPLYHPAMKHAMPVRRSLGTRTIFNILGPLTNPAGATCQLIGVFDGYTAEKIFKAASHIPFQRLLIVHGSGLDEASVTGPSTVWSRIEGIENEYTIRPEEYGFRKRDIEELRVRSPGESAEVIIDLLSGKGQPARVEFFLINAGLAALAAGLAASLEDGLALMEEVLKSGAARDKLEELRRSVQ